MVKGEYLVIDQALYKVEPTPANQHQSNEVATGNGCAATQSGPKQENAGECSCEREEVKEPVGERVVLQPSNCCRGVVTRTCEQVVPLENLVKDDSVEESAEPYSEQDSCISDRGPISLEPPSSGHSPATPSAYALSGMNLRRVLSLRRALLPLRGLPQSGSQHGSSHRAQR